RKQTRPERLRQTNVSNDTSLWGVACSEAPASGAAGGAGRTDGENLIELTLAAAGHNDRPGGTREALASRHDEAGDRLDPRKGADSLSRTAADPPPPPPSGRRAA